MKEYNIWLIYEEIDQDTEDNGTDTAAYKVASFKNKKKADIAWVEAVQDYGGRI